MDIRVAKNTTELTAHLPAWELLVAAADNNPFFEPWFCSIAFEHLGSADVQVAFVYDDRELCGVFPLQMRHRVSALRLKVCTTWRHDHCALAQPLLRTSREQETVEAFLRWFDNNPALGSFLLFDFIDPSTQSSRAIVDALRASGRATFLLDSFERAAFVPTKSVDDYLQKELTHHRRKELGRLRRRLAEKGRISVVVYDTQDPSAISWTDTQLTQWMQDFMALEVEGWKGLAGSALTSVGAENRFFSSLVTCAHGRHQLLLMDLRVEGKPVAMKCDIISGSFVYTYKIAYDEQLSRFSPGVLLEIDHMRYFERTSRVSFIDSCAVPEHPMINRLWQERRPIVSILSHRKIWWARLIVSSVLPILRRLRAVGR